MRGRTNIPPRTGGVVSGVIRNYEVAESNGIAVGDYVQLVEDSSAMRISDPVTMGKVVPTNSDGWIKNFILSDHRSCSFILDTDGLYAITQDVGSVLPSQMTKTKIVTQSSLTGVSSISSVQLSEDEFLVLFQKSDITELFSEIIYYNGEFSSTQVYTADTSGISPSSFATGALFTCEKVSTNRFLLVSGRTALFNLDNTTHKMVLTSSVTMSPVQVAVVNGFACLKASSGLLYSYSCTNGVLTQIDSLDTGVSGKYVFRFDSDKLIACTVGGSYTSVSKYSISISLKMIQVGSNGSISIVGSYSESDIQISRTATGSPTSPYFYSLSPVITALASGKFFVSTYVILRTGTSSSYRYALYGIPCCIGYYDEAEQEFVLGVFQDNYSYSGGAGSTSSYYVQVSNSVNDDQSGIYQFVFSDSSPKAYGAQFKVEQMNILPVSQNNLIKKYTNVIHGVAKTGGLYGDIIQVYSPE